MISAFLIFSFLAVCIVLKTIQKKTDTSNASPVFSQIQISIGENYHLLIVKSVLFVLMIFLIMNYKLFSPLIYFYVIIVTILLLLLYVSGYRYK